MLDSCSAHGTVFRNASLSGANLNYAWLPSADLTEAGLANATLRWANLTGACLVGAYLRSADLSGANLTDANLTHCLGVTQPQLDLALATTGRRHLRTRSTTTRASPGLAGQGT